MLWIINQTVTCVLRQSFGKWRFTLRTEQQREGFIDRVISRDVERGSMQGRLGNKLNAV